MTPATLLLVDDSEAIAELIVEVLTDAGYAVEWVADGNRAMELVERRPRLVLTDMMHPGPDGGAIARRCVELGVPAILTSACPPDHAPDGVAVVPKPFDLEGLLRTVSELASGR